jgi:hypothetical protein
MTDPVVPYCPPGRVAAAPIRGLEQNKQTRTPDSASLHPGLYAVAPFRGFSVAVSLLHLASTKNHGNEILVKNVIDKEAS